MRTRMLLAVLFTVLMGSLLLYAQAPQPQATYTTTADPVYVANRWNPFSTTTSGGLRVAATIVAGGTVTANQGTSPWVISGAVSQSGTWTVQPGNTANTTAWKVDNSAVNQPVVGATAVGATYAGNPVNIACKAVTAEQTAVANGQEVNCVADLVGKPIVLPYANPENFVNGTVVTITDTTSTATIASAGGSLRNYVTHCTLTNSHATVSTQVQILDGATVIDQVYLVAAGGGAALVYPVPLKGTAATAVNIKPVTTGSNIVGMCNGYKGL